MTPSPLTLSPEQETVWTAVRDTPDNLLISAVAGGAKTTTMVEIAKRLGNTGQRVVALAFNKEAQLSLESKMPYWVQSQTFHSFCLDALSRHLGFKPKIDGRRVPRFLKELVPNWKQRTEIEDEVTQLVSLAKAAGYACRGAELEYDLSLSYLADYYGIGGAVLGYAERILTSCAADPSTIDFDDMLWLTLKLSVAFPTVSLYFLDEAQDTNPVQRMLLERMLTDSENQIRNSAAPIGSRPPPRLIAVGDPHQSIYGFRGADSNSMEMLQTTFNMTSLNLSFSYRCSQAVVLEARKYL